KAARRARAWPEMVVKSPPTYRVPPLIVSAGTQSFGSGLQAATEPLASTWARFVRGCPPTRVKNPPMYQPPVPSGIALETYPVTSGNLGTVVVEARSKGTQPPAAGPTAVKAPPT